MSYPLIKQYSAPKLADANPFSTDEDATRFTDEKAGVRSSANTPDGLPLHVSMAT